MSAMPPLATVGLGKAACREGPTIAAEAMELWVAESDETHRGKLSASWDA
jgi:hypothetical protein